MKIEDLKFTLTRESGEKVTCDVLLIFTNEETGRDYIVFTDQTRDPSGAVMIYASVYIEDEQTHEVSLREIETEEEWETVRETFERVRTGVPF